MGIKKLAKFEFVWRCMNGQKLIAEHRFHPTRKWRVDWFHESGVAIEIEGSVWTQGRHTRGSGCPADIEKYNALAEQGILLFRVPAHDVTIKRLVPIYDTIQRGGSLTYQKNKEAIP